MAITKRNETQRYSSVYLGRTNTERSHNNAEVLLITKTLCFHKQCVMYPWRFMAGNCKRCKYKSYEVCISGYSQWHQVCYRV